MVGDERVYKIGFIDFYLWDQSHVTIVWNNRETGKIDTKLKYLRRWFCKKLMWDKNEINQKQNFVYGGWVERDPDLV